MPATPADIAKYTTDGIVVTASNQAILDSFPDARDGSTEEIEMFYDNASDAQDALDELFVIQSARTPPHVAVDLEESLLIGEEIPIDPYVPCFALVDEEAGVNEPLRVISYAYEMGSDQRSVELHR